jgi:uncharacterized membrane protein YgdD (TMEM256/DUF423 family)
MNGSNWVRIGAILGALGVGFGAFGAHGLTPSLKDFNSMDPIDREATARRLATYEDGVRYHMYHALAIVAVGLVAMRNGPSRMLNASAGLFLFGIVAFSGVLYGIGAGGPKSLGMYAPFGGVALILGWIVFALGLSGRPSAAAPT